MHQILLSIIIISFTAFAYPAVWINMSRESTEFQNHVLNEGDRTIVDYYLSVYEKRNVDQRLLLEKIDFFSKSKMTPFALDNEIQNLQKSYIFSSSNRLLIFEYLKLEAATAKSLCNIYANDLSLKESEPFFESSCALSRISLATTNPDLAKFDYMIIDGNKIDIQASPYFFTSGQAHQFVFISNSYQTQEITSTVTHLKKTPVTLTPWVEGECDQDIKSSVSISEPVKIYFSKKCVQNLDSSDSTTVAFIKRNKYYIISSLLISVAALYVSSQYELGVSLP